MTESQGQEQQVPQGQEDSQQVDSTETQSGTGTNPAWNDILNVIPEMLQPQIKPTLEKWDQNYQTGIQKVHSQYEPWKPFIDNGVEPQDVDFALGLLNAVSTNPQEVLAALQEWIDGEDGGTQDQFEQQGQFDTPEQSDQWDISQDPRFQEMESALQTMAQIMLGQREEEQQALADSELDTEIKGLQEKYGDFDEEYVLGIAMANPNVTLEQAVERYTQLQDQILSGKRQPGPPVLGGGGSAPNSNVDTSKLSSSDTRARVAQMLQQAAQQNG